MPNEHSQFMSTNGKICLFFSSQLVQVFIKLTNKRIMCKIISLQSAGIFWAYTQYPH